MRRMFDIDEIKSNSVIEDSAKVEDLDIRTYICHLNSKLSTGIYIIKIIGKLNNSVTTHTTMLSINSNTDLSYSNTLSTPYNYISWQKEVPNQLIINRSAINSMIPTSIELIRLQY